MIDSVKAIKIIHDTVYVKGADALDIVTKVDSFYKSAMGNLTLVFTISLAVLAIAIPVALIALQNANTAKLESRLRALVKSNFDTHITSTQENINNIMSEAKNRAEGNAFILQARILVNENRFSESIASCIVSIDAYLLIGSNEQPIERVLSNIRAVILGLLNIEDRELKAKEFNIIKSDVDLEFMKFIESIRVMKVSDESNKIIKEIKQYLDEIERVLSI